MKFPLKVRDGQPFTDILDADGQVRITIYAERGPTFSVVRKYEEAAKFTQQVVDVLNQHAAPAGSRALNDPTLSAKDRALKIAADALRKIANDSHNNVVDAANACIETARDELARIRTLVPEIDR